MTNIRDKLTEALSDIEAIGHVECGENKERHTIVLLRNGRLVLLDHYRGEGIVDDMRKKANLAPEHACARVLRNWASRDGGWRSGGVPAGLQESFEAARVRRNKRSAHKQYVATATEQASVPLRDRFTARVREAALSVLDSDKNPIKYRRSKRHHSHRVNIANRDVAPVLKMVTTINKRSGRVNSTQANFTLPLRWYARVFTKGYAVVDGVLVLDTIKASPIGGYRVIAARQAKDYEIHPCEASVYKKADGTWTLTWGMSTRQWNASHAIDPNAPAPKEDDE